MKFYDFGPTGLLRGIKKPTLILDYGASFFKTTLKRKIIMRINIILILMTTTLLQVSASTYAQKITLAKNNASIVDIFKAIQAQSDYDFIYSNRLINKAGKVNIHVAEAPLLDVLEICFKNQPFTYSIKDRTIVIKEREHPFQKQDIVEVDLRIDITGKVIDKNGLPVPGVSVKYKGSNIGSVTDMDGNYKINSPDGNGTLVFSSIGYVTQEVLMNNRTKIDIVLAEDLQGLSEVLVVGYGTQKKVNLTGAVSQITSERLEKRAVTNIDQALQGVAPGLNITTNTALGGEPNANMGMNIRGIGSLSGGSPYILVDNAPMDLNNVNPADVESISVLKDAASTAIYGSRAAYGVILITTKSGKLNEQMKVSYNNNFAMAEPTYLPGFVNSLTFANSINEAATNSGQNRIFNDETLARIVKYQADPVNTPSMVKNPSDPNGWGYWNLGNANTDWYDVLYKDWALSQRHNAGISGGSKNTNYYVGLGWLDEPGKLNFANEQFQRYNLTTNISLKVTDKFTVSMKAKLNRSYQKFFQSQTAGDRQTFFTLMGISWPTDPVYTPNGDFALDKNQPPVLANGGSDKQYTTDLWLNPSFELKLAKGWKVNGDVSFNTNSYRRSDHRKIIWGLATDGITPIKHYSQNWNRMNQELSYNEYFTSNVFTEYSKQIKNHSFSVLLGGQAELSNDLVLSGWRRDLISESVPAISTAIGDKDVDENMSHWSTLGTFMRFSYNFNEKYLLELNGRYDGSSRFQSGRRWGFFPSASVGYNIWKEKFWEPVADVINTLKLRASYGSLGNQNVANYLHVETVPIQTNLPYIIDGKRPVYTGVPSNRSLGLTWETSKTLNFGIDAEALNNRLGFSFDWYNRRTENMFGPGESVPAVYGAAVPLNNNATLETKGIELSVNWKQVVNSNLNYNVGVVLSDNKTVITKYNNPTNFIGNFYEGQNYGDVWGYETAGLFQTDAEANAWASQASLYSRWGAGDVKYNDLNGDGKITNGNQTLANSGDLKVIGNTSPRYLFGINTNVSYKLFDFTMFLQGVGKRDLWMSSQFFYGFGGSWTSTIIPAHALDYWSPSNNDSYFARPYLTTENFKNQQVQSRYLQNAAYMRLKNIQVGFSLPKELSKRIGIERARFFVGGENVFTFSKMMDSFDPETNVRSARGSMVYPLSRAFTGGVNITF
jgi:TonB-linked SusC/RagA family outer membrane protein